MTELNPRRRGGILLFVVLLLHGNIAVAGRENTDVITLRNGDRITGEIKSLEFGILQFETSQMGTLSIEWPAVAGIVSNYGFFIERSGGGRYYGSIQADAQGQFTVRDGDNPAENMPALEVMRISQVEDSLWKRINGSISMGYNFTKSSDISTGNLAVTTEYRSERLESVLTVNAQFTDAPDQERTDRELISNTTRFVRPHANYWVALTSVERNEELGIDGRLQLGGAIGRHFIQKPTSELTGLIGLSLNQEWVTGSTTQQSVEGVLGADWRIFKFSDPETSLTSSLRLYPGISESGRWRSELNLVVSREIFTDFTIDLTYYNSYDSEPPDATAASSDYGIVTGFGYKF